MTRPFPVSKSLKADALTVLGEHCVTATGRNSDLTVAKELRDSIASAPSSP